MNESRRDLTPSDETQSAETAQPSSLEELAQLVAVERERAQSAERRLAAQQALLDERLLGIEKNRVFSAWNAALAWLRDFRLPGRPAESDRRQLQSARAGYAAWVANEQAELPDAELAISTLRSWSFRPLVSIVMRPGRREDEIATLRSISDQLYTYWDVYVESASSPSTSETGLPAGRVHFVSIVSTGDPADPSPFVGSIAGEYVWIVEPGDLLSRHALYYMIEALQEHRRSVIYADEDLHRFGSRVQPEFKPDWSPHLLAARMYIGRAFLSPTALLRQFSPAEHDQSVDWRHDLLLRFAAANIAVLHVSKVLYHRMDSGSVERQQERPAARPRSSTARRFSPRAGKTVTAVICSRSAELVSKCLDSLNATAGPLIDQVIVVAHEQAGPDLTLRSAIERRGAVAMPFTGRFNFSSMNNLAARNISSPHLLFLNDDITATEFGWLERLVEQIEEHGAGIAGATLWYPSGLLQHAGIVSGSGDGVVHIGRYSRGSVLWPWLLETRDVSAVTGACLCISAALFRSLGGFDTSFPNNYNDADLCFRARATGRSVVCVAMPALIHAECASRQGIVRFEERHRFFQKWDTLLSHTDPYYSPNLASTEGIQLDLSGKSGFRALLNDDEHS